MADVREQPNGTSILDLSTELIVQICSYDVITTTDIIKQAVAHKKLNDCLFGEQNSSLWRSKFVQQYGNPDNYPSFAKNYVNVLNAMMFY